MMELSNINKMLKSISKAALCDSRDENMSLVSRNKIEDPEEESDSTLIRIYRFKDLPEGTFIKITSAKDSEGGLSNIDISLVTSAPETKIIYTEL